MDGSEDQKIRRPPPGPPHRSWWPPPRGTVRDAIAITLAVVIVIHETLMVGTAEPALLVLAAGLLGVPLAARGAGGR